MTAIRKYIMWSVSMYIFKVTVSGTQTRLCQFTAFELVAVDAKFASEIELNLK